MGPPWMLVGAAAILLVTRQTAAQLDIGATLCYKNYNTHYLLTLVLFIENINKQAMHQSLQNQLKDIYRWR
ncbi:hypothetical protein FQR65_LT07727 [Abscondita terminalis]|nr:hypothetical protein FQR65_LT07727 [Abscondita terminalis]